MKSLIRNLSVASVFIAVAVSGVFAQQPGQSNLEFLVAKSHRFLSYEDDFVAFAHNAKGDDKRTTFELFDAASSVHQFVFAAGSLLNIYDSLSCRSDRESAWAIIRTAFDHYARQTENHIKTVNSRLSYVKVPAVAASGTQMKEDMRELKAFFETVRPKREGEK
jgi:hypothetical protein